MLIIPLLNPFQSLFLDAYSYQQREIDAVALTLRNLRVQFDIADLDRDRNDRKGLRHRIPIADVARLEVHLGIRFQGEGTTTRISVVAPPGAGYKCKEITVRDSGSGCVNLTATDEADAMVKCALLARHNGWFGGEAEPGTCA
jgi:hypothetical protein